MRALAKSITSVTPFGRRLIDALREIVDEFELLEDDREGNILDKIIIVRTPGYVLLEDFRKHMRQAAHELLPAAVSCTFVFEPNE
jgi:hypothetical protein